MAEQVMAVFIPATIHIRTRRNPEAHLSRWHVIGPDGDRTGCGRPIIGTERKVPWGETPTDERCSRCVDALVR